MGNFKLSKNSKKNIFGINSDLEELVKRVLKKSDHDFGIPSYGGLRTKYEQRELYLKVPKVTWCDGFRRKSYHQSGRAVDIFIYDEHGACWDCIEKYEHVAELMKAEFIIMKEEGLFEGFETFTWGGDWKGRKCDRPHFQISK